MSTSSEPSLDYAHEEDFDEFLQDSCSASSDLSELSATRLARHPEYGIIWEILQDCQEAAVTDIPERFSECMSIFDIEHSSVSITSQVETFGYEGLFQAAGAIQNSEPWSLPAVTRPLSDEDVLLASNMRVLNVAQVIPIAAVYLEPDAALFEEFQNITDSATAVQISENFKNALDSASPLVDAKSPLFASAVFTTASQMAHDGEKVSFYTLRRHNRLATTSLLRQAHAFCIDGPVFGILLHGNAVAIHIDWYEECNENLSFHSTFYTPDDNVVDIKAWDLRHPIDTTEIKIILSNLREYTAGPYAARVHRSLKAVKRPVKQWKWTSMLPQVSGTVRLPQGPAETPKEKIGRWRESIDRNMVVDAVHATRLKHVERQTSGHGQAKQLRDILSPPHTPQSPADSYTVD